MRERSAPDRYPRQAAHPAPPPPHPTAAPGAPTSANALSRSNRSVAYSSVPTIPPARPPRRASPPGSAPGQTSSSNSQPAQTTPRPPQARAPPRRVLQRQHHLEQRVPRQRPRRVEQFHQPLERHLLMPIGRQDCLPAPGRSVRAKLGRPEVSVRSTSVLTKNPTRSSSAASVRPAIGAPIAMSVPRPEPAQQRRKQSLQHHEQARPALARKPQHAGVQIGRQQNPDRSPPVARNRRPRPVGRQIQLLRQAGKPLPPIRQLPRQRARRIALIPQHACCHSV